MSKATLIVSSSFTGRFIFLSGTKKTEIKRNLVKQDFFCARKNLKLIFFYFNNLIIMISETSALCNLYSNKKIETSTC